MARKLISVPMSIAEDLYALAKRNSLPASAVINALLDFSEDVDWEEVKKEFKSTKSSWKNIAERVNEYQEKYPQATSEELSRFTGYSLYQIRVITHEAHTDVLRTLRAYPKWDVSDIAHHSKVSERFVVRIQEQLEGIRKIPKNEAYLFTAK